jgi:hydrophobic/amphiphilic exporter-1 (mainly G- bacteria), HAE1 family
MPCMTPTAANLARSGKQRDEIGVPFHHGIVVMLLTFMAAFMGTLPIALGFGAGAEARRPLGLAVVGGLVVSQLLTLYITPVVYYYMDRLGEKTGSFVRRLGGQRHHAADN